MSATAAELVPYLIDIRIGTGRVVRWTRYATDEITARESAAKAASEEFFPKRTHVMSVRAR